MFADWGFNFKFEQFWSGNHLEQMKHYFYNCFLELNKSQHIEDFFEYSLMAIQKWLLGVWWFESDFSAFVSELESEQ